MKSSSRLCTEKMIGSMIGLRSWIEAPRGRHTEKPDAVREMIERASPGPRLELFARQLVPGWFSWGHEIVAPLSSQIQMPRLVHPSPQRSQHEGLVVGDSLG